MKQRVYEGRAVRNGPCVTGAQDFRMAQVELSHEEMTVDSFLLLKFIYRVHAAAFNYVKSSAKGMLMNCGGGV